MNPIALTHLIAGLAAVAVSLPLIKRKIRMNPWYGIRIPAAFASDERWFEINEYGGRLLLRWGVLIAAVAVPGCFLSKTWWPLYGLASTAIIALSLGLVLRLIFRHARATGKS